MLNLLKVSNFVFSLGVTVKTMSDGNYYDVDSKTIHIVADASIYTLLHEAGHAYAYANCPKGWGSDELLAWKLGLEIARELNLDIDLDAYLDRAHSCLSTYGIYPVDMKRNGYRVWGVAPHANPKNTVYTRTEAIWFY